MKALLALFIWEPEISQLLVYSLNICHERRPGTDSSIWGPHGWQGPRPSSRHLLCLLVQIGRKLPPEAERDLNQVLTGTRVSQAASSLLRSASAAPRAARHLLLLASQVRLVCFVSEVPSHTPPLHCTHRTQYSCKIPSSLPPPSSSAPAPTPAQHMAAWP